MQKLLVEIFYDVDNYCIAFEEYCRNYFIEESNCSNFSIIKSRNLSLSEVMTIIIYFHLSSYRNFKAYYTKCVSTVLRPYFAKIVSYNRFVELMYEKQVNVYGRQNYSQEKSYYRDRNRLFKECMSNRAQPP